MYKRQHHTPEQIAAMAANAVTTDENGNEQPATIADVEIILAAAELPTFDYWKMCIRDRAVAVKRVNHFVIAEIFRGAVRVNHQVNAVINSQIGFNVFSASERDLPITLGVETERSFFSSSV